MKQILAKRMARKMADDELRKVSGAYAIAQTFHATTCQSASFDDGYNTDDGPRFD